MPKTSCVQGPNVNDMVPPRGEAPWGIHKRSGSFTLGVSMIGLEPWAPLSKKAIDFIINSNYTVNIFIRYLEYRRNRNAC